MTVKYLLVFFYSLLLFVSSTKVMGQYYDLGQDPSHLKWRQINTRHFKLVYPENFEVQAQKMVKTLDFMYINGTKTLMFNPSKVPLILHNYNTISNAVTVWTPKRIELFTTPPQDSYAQNWLDQLVIHEYRHVIQLDRTNQGFTRFLSFLTGEQAAAAVSGLYIPSWFLEGDAVCTETALSSSGRGRIPSFEMILRAQILEKVVYSYDKAVLGSFESFVPNQYELGYSLVANIRRKYGYQAWVTALNEVARKPLMITPFNHGLKKATGFGKEKLYRMSMFDLQSMWKKQDAKTPKTSYTQFSVSSLSRYCNNKFPKYLNDTLVVSEFSSMDEIARFEIIGSSGYRKTITSPGFLSAENYSLVRLNQSDSQNASSGRKNSENNFLLAWTETIDDPRWGQRNYSEIRTYDSRTRKTSTLTHKSRYFAPAISPDGHTIAAVQVDPENRSSIVLLDSKDGNEIDKLISSETDFYMTPSWSADGKSLAFTKLDSLGKSINIYDLEKKSIKEIVAPTYIEISNPVLGGKYLFFNGSYSGIENIYAADIKTKEIFQVTSAKFGASNPDISPNRKKIVYSDYSSSGFSAVETNLNPDSWKKLDEIQDYSASLYKYLVKEESQFADSVPVIQRNSIESKPYSKYSHIFNFHSWAPAYINYMSGENGLGISFMSQNELSTATTVIGYKYDVFENTGKVTADFSWKGWYPIIDLNTSYGARAAYTGGDSSVRFNFNETVLSGGLTLPLIFTGGKYYKGLQLRLHTSWIDITNNTSPAAEKDKITGTINSIDYSFSAYRFIKQSQKDIYPRWGQVVTGAFRNSPFGKNDYGSIASLGLRCYFPGFMLHHSIKLDLNYQSRDFTKYYFPNQIIAPRGYLLLKEKNIGYFALNYKFPLAYPDFSLGSIVYIKRVKLNLFYDAGYRKLENATQKLKSEGFELTSDMHFLRFVFPVDLGFRYSYHPIEKQYFVDLLFSVNLSN